MGYVDFVSVDSVGLAIRLNNQEVCGRKVRVARAVRKAKPGKVMVPDADRKRGKYQPSASGGQNKNYKGTKSNSGASDKKLSRSQAYKKERKEGKPEGKSFQGLSSTVEGKPKRSFNKTVQKNKIIAKKLAS